MKARYARSLLWFFVASLSMPAQSANQSMKRADSGDLAALVARMARIGSAFGASFSPDGKWVSFVSNLSGVPQLWIVPAEGGYPRMVTNGDDPVVQAEWSPSNEWISDGCHFHS